MGWFPCWGTNAGFPWFMVIMPLFFFGMMVFFCRSSRSTWFAGCCGRRREADLAAEVSGLRREVEEMKKKLG